MIYTCYFAKYKHDNGISIALKSPDWFNGEAYSPLFPKWSFLKQYFKDKNETNYIEQYNKLVLNQLDPIKVYKDLNGKVLLCWEKTGKFCHRRLVAEWLESSLNVQVFEINDNRKYT